MGGETATEQVNAIFKVIGKAIQKAGGRGLEDVVIVRMIGANVQKDFEELGDAVNGVFSGTGNKPANTLFGGDLLLPWMKVEIEVTAVIQPDVGRRTVLVTSSTGRIGKEVLARLSSSGQFNVRAAVHNPEKSEYLRGIGAHELVQFDYTDPATWDEALDGVSAIYSAS